MRGDTGVDKYLYNGKELQEDLGLETYAYEFRMYEPALGRWWQQDPVIKEHESPYAWVTNNPVRFFDVMGLDTFNITLGTRNIDRVAVENSENHVYIIKNEEGEVVGTQSLAINEFGLVQFPESGEGFGRYGIEDPAEIETRTIACEDGSCVTESTNIGPGDHYLKPEAAAALFGLTTEMSLNDENFRVDFGDMSNAWGFAPGNDHVTHGGPRGYSGVSIDYRYLNSNNQSYQGTATGSNFNYVKNASFLLRAYSWGFTKNYVSNRVASWGKIRLPGAKPIGGHNDHGHLTYIKK